MAPYTIRGELRRSLLRWWKFSIAVAAVTMPITMATMPNPTWFKIVLAPFAWPIATLPFIVMLLLLLPRSRDPLPEYIGQRQGLAEKVPIQAAGPGVRQRAIDQSLK